MGLVIKCLTITKQGKKILAECTKKVIYSAETGALAAGAAFFPALVFFGETFLAAGFFVLFGFAALAFVGDDFLAAGFLVAAGFLAAFFLGDAFLAFGALALVDGAAAVDLAALAFFGDDFLADVFLTGALAVPKRNEPLAPTPLT